MKIIGFSLSVLMLLAISCNVDNSSVEIGKKNVAVVEKYIKSVENNDIATMASLLDDNYMGYGPSHSDSINKEVALLAFESNMTHLYSKLKYNTSRIAPITFTSGLSKGNWVANWAELEITYRNGQGPITIWANTNYLLEDGKILRSVTFYNVLDALQQLEDTY